MGFYENHRLQTIFILLQFGVIMAGSLTAGVILKVMGYEEGNNQAKPFYILFVRNWGFLLILIPLAWTFTTISMERRTDWFSKRWVVGSGLTVLLALSWFLVGVILRSGSSLIVMSQ